jgi:hypothetical protein
MELLKVISINNYFCWHLEGNRQKEQNPGPEQDLVTDKKGRIWIRL